MSREWVRVAGGAARDGLQIAGCLARTRRDLDVSVLIPLPDAALGRPAAGALEVSAAVPTFAQYDGDGDGGLRGLAGR